MPKHHEDELEKAIHKPSIHPPTAHTNDMPPDGDDDGGGPPTKPDPPKQPGH